MHYRVVVVAVNRDRAVFVRIAARLLLLAVGCGDDEAPDDPSPPYGSISEGHRADCQCSGALQEAEENCYVGPAPVGDTVRLPLCTCTVLPQECATAAPLRDFPVVDAGPCDLGGVTQESLEATACHAGVHLVRSSFEACPITLITDDLLPGKSHHYFDENGERVAYIEIDVLGSSGTQTQCGIRPECITQSETVEACELCRFDDGDPPSCE